MWVKESAYYERPTVAFRHEILGLISGSTADSVLAFGTSKSFLEAYRGSISSPVLYATPKENSDGEIVEILVEASFQIGSNATVHGIQGVLTFDYALDVRYVSNAFLLLNLSFLSVRSNWCDCRSKLLFSSICILLPLHAQPMSMAICPYDRSQFFLVTCTKTLSDFFKS